jgi:hypothetical protein
MFAVIIIRNRLFLLAYAIPALHRIAINRFPYPRVISARGKLPELRSQCWRDLKVIVRMVLARLVN